MNGNCLICGGKLELVLDLGRQPRANAFIANGELTNDEYFYELKLGFCESCMLTQTFDRPNKEKMFNERYAYHTSVNQPMLKHFAETADILKKICDTDFVVEIGSNDGAFLRHFIQGDHLGIEPSLNVIDDAMKQGIDCWGTFFSEKVANQIVKTKREASLIYAANVFGHVEEMNDVLAGVKTLLSPRGTFVFEIYYLPSILKNNSFDLIYDEHIFYYTLSSLKRLLNNFNLRLVDFSMMDDIHGGSIRCYVEHDTCLQQRRLTSQELIKQLTWEVDNGFETIEPLRSFAGNVKRTGDDLIELFSRLKDEGKSIVGYGATAKSTTVLNYCHLGTEMLDFIVDSTPCKQGTLSPGTHVPVVPEDEFKQNPPDYAVLFAWNYAEQIMNKQRWFSERGGKWILLHPNVMIV